jgi:3-deoxy-D-manno-octulosonic-acid transferase
MRQLYIVLAYLLLPLAFGMVLWRGLRDRDYWHNLGERFGFGAPLAGNGSLWVHAVSVGEVQAAAALVRALRLRHPQMPLVLTTVTPTGAQLARRLFGESVHVRYIPYDLPGCVRRFFRRVQPRLALIMETELWPNLFHECGRRRVPLVLASARISPRSVSRYRRMVPLFRSTLSHGIVIAAQTVSDAQRFVSIGASAERTNVTGNIKFDFELPPQVLAGGRELRDRMAGTRPVWVAGSTHEGEELIVLDAHRQVRDRYPDALLLLAPRHRHRFEAVAELLRQRGMAYVTRSGGAGVTEGVTEQVQVLLIDSLGELMNFYAAADVAFVGGSLVPVGGHNLLEPAALSLPILTGPHNFNSEEIADLLIQVGAARKVHDAVGLAAQVTTLLSDPAERVRIGTLGRRTLDENRGALGRLLSLVEPLLPG